jgi:Rieske [2Fe-2S] domain
MEGFEEVAKTSEIPEGAVKSVKVSGTDVMVANIEGKLYAIANKCTHVGGPLAKGKFRDRMPMARLKVRREDRCGGDRSRTAAGADLSGEGRELGGLDKKAVERARAHFGKGVSFKSPSLI